MKKFNLNLSKFKKVSSDKEHTVLQAPEGHQIKVKHSALHPKMREQLAAIPMAEGGDVEDPTQEQLLPGDKEPNKIEKKVVKGVKRRMLYEGTDGQELSGPEEDYRRTNGEAAQHTVDEANKGDPNVRPASKPKSIAQKDSEDFSKGASQAISHPIENLTHPTYAKGGPVRQYAEGTPDSPILPEPVSSQMPETALPADSDIQNAISAPQSQDDIYKQAIADSRATASQRATDLVGTLKNAGNFLLHGPQSSQQPDLTQQGAPSPDATAADTKVPPTPTYAPPAQEQPADVNPSPIMKGIEEEKQGLQEQYQAGAALAQGQQAALQQDQEARDQAMGNYAARAQALDDERQGFVQDLQNSHIDPNHYLNSMGTMGRISSAIGIILGGGAAGATGGPNQALQYLQSNIDRDISAQQANIGVKQNLLSANLRQFGNLRDATDMTRVMQNDAVSHQMQMAAAKAGTQNAHANYMMAKGALDQKSAMLMATLNARQTINNPGAPKLEVDHALNVLRMVDPSQAKEVEGRYVPGLGIATVPVPDNVRAQLIERNTLSNNITQLIAFQRKYGGTLEGMADPTVRHTGEALAKQVQDQYRRANQQGVFKPAEAEFVNSVVSDSPSSLFSKYTKLPGYRMAAQINQGNLNQLKSSYGLRSPAPIQAKPPVLPNIK